MRFLARLLWTHFNVLEADGFPLDIRIRPAFDQRLRGLADTSDRISAARARDAAEPRPKPSSTPSQKRRRPDPV